MHIEVFHSDVTICPFIFFIVLTSFNSKHHLLIRFLSKCLLYWFVKHPVNVISKKTTLNRGIFTISKPCAVCAMISVFLQTSDLMSCHGYSWKERNVQNWILCRFVYLCQNWHIRIWCLLLNCLRIWGFSIMCSLLGHDGRFLKLF